MERRAGSAFSWAGPVVVDVKGEDTKGIAVILGSFQLCREFVLRWAEDGGVPDALTTGPEWQDKLPRSAGACASVEREEFVLRGAKAEAVFRTHDENLQTRKNILRRENNGCQFDYSGISSRPGENAKHRT